MQATLDHALWKQIIDFDFDDTDGDYCFSVRLAQEQEWTTHFTERAILEYRRFMYLAATENFMVSPSAMVDEVWHLHLLFTVSYQRFCRLLGKEIAHIPSTHSKAEGVKFKEAKSQTAAAYESAFGPMPTAIWECNTMAESLGLKRKGPTLEHLILMGILVFALLLPIALWALKPIYATLDNPYFLWGYGALLVTVFYLLEWRNRTQFQRMIARFPKDAFPFYLTPAEGIFIKTGLLSTVIAGVVNGLIQKQVAVVNDRNMLELQERDTSLTAEEQLAVRRLEEQCPLEYPMLLRQLLDKPIFRNTQNGSNTLKREIGESGWFKAVFAGNFCVLGVVLLLGLIRILTGVIGDKPIVYIVIIMIVVFCIATWYLNRLTQFANAITIPNVYKSELLSKGAKPEWNYFLLGPAALAISFAPLVRHVGQDTSGTGGDSSGSDSGNSCGSSCGSSCGGCGGGD